MVADRASGVILEDVPDEVSSWTYIKPLGWLYIAYLTTSLIMGLLARDHLSLTMEHSLEAVDALVTFGFCYRYRADLRPILALRLPQLRSLLVFGASCTVFVVLAFAVFRLLSGLGLPFLSMTEQYTAAHISVWLILLSISIAPAIWEELAFRGLIQTALGRVLSQREAWIVQAGLFSVLHLSPIIFVTHFGLGLAFGWMRNKWQSIYPGMALHALWNAVVVMDELHPWLFP